MGHPPGSRCWGILLRGRGGTTKQRTSGYRTGWQTRTTRTTTAGPSRRKGTTGRREPEPEPEPEPVIPEPEPEPEPELPVEYCTKCSLGIFKGDMKISAMEKSFHTSCFSCIVCHKVIEGSFRAYKEQPLCMDCDVPSDVKHDICGICSKQITAGSKLAAMDQFFHADCFKCIVCHTPIGLNGSFRDYDGKPLCSTCPIPSDDTPRTDVLCGGCGKSVTGNSILAIDRHWHNSCFKCSLCNNLIGDGTFLNSGGQPICVPCSETSGNPCGHCGEVVKMTQQSLQVGENQYHSTCFSCFKCKGNLDGGIFVLPGEIKLYCGNCKDHL